MAKAIEHSQESWRPPSSREMSPIIAHHDDVASQLAMLDDVMDMMIAAFDPAYGEAWNRAQTKSMLLMPSTRLWTISLDGATATAASLPEQKSAMTNIGFVISSRCQDEEEIMLIAIIPDWRSQGLGKMLLQAIFKDATASGVAKLFLEVRSNNPAIRFYNRLGFSAIGHRKNYYNGIDGQKYDAVTLKRAT